MRLPDRRAPVEFSQGRIDEMVVAQKRIAGERFQDANSRGWPFQVRQDNRPIELVDRGWLQVQERVVQSQDRPPVRLGKAGSGAVQQGDSRFEVKLRDRCSVGRLIEKVPSADNERLAPFRPVLVFEQEQLALNVGAGVKSGRMEEHECQQGE